MKKHMLKETNDMRRLMGLKLLKEDFEETGVMGVDAPESKDELEKDEEDHGDVVNEDSEGEETYNYGEDEGADEHREDEMEDELHHDEEDMAPHDRIKAIEDHLAALKKDMAFDEEHEDRDEEGTHFAESNELSESQVRNLRRRINK